MRRLRLSWMGRHSAKGSTGEFVVSGVVQSSGSGLRADSGPWAPLAVSDSPSQSHPPLRPTSVASMEGSGTVASRQSCPRPAARPNPDLSPAYLPSQSDGRVRRGAPARRDQRPSRAVDHDQPLPAGRRLVNPAAVTCQSHALDLSQTGLDLRHSHLLTAPLCARSKPTPTSA